MLATGDSAAANPCGLSELTEAQVKAAPLYTLTYPLRARRRGARIRQDDKASARHRWSVSTISHPIRRSADDIHRI